LIDQGEAAGVAEYMRIAGMGKPVPSHPMPFCRHHAVRRSLTKKASAYGFIFALSASPALIARSSSARNWYGGLPPTEKWQSTAIRRVRFY